MAITKERPQKSIGLKQSIQFDADTHEELLRMAQRRKISFAELVRMYCEWGLETDG